MKSPSPWQVAAFNSEGMKKSSSLREQLMVETTHTHTSKSMYFHPPRAAQGPGGGRVAVRDSVWNHVGAQKGILGYFLYIVHIGWDILRVRFVCIGGLSCKTQKCKVKVGVCLAYVRICV